MRASTGFARNRRIRSVLDVARQENRSIHCYQRTAFVWNRRATQFRGFSSAVSDPNLGIGHGVAPQRPSGPSPRSPEQERAAQLEYERMERATERLIQLEYLSPASLQEFRVAFQYWVGRRPIAVSSSPDVLRDAANYAEALWEWMLENGDPETLMTIIRTDTSPIGGLINLMERYLLPFRGTHQSFVVSKRRLRFLPQAVDYQEALGKASTMLEHIEQLLEDESYELLVPDRYTCNMKLNVWAKRCWFLSTFREHKLEEAFVKTALAGVSTPLECLQRMDELINTMKTDSRYPAPEQDSIMLLMTAWVNSGLPDRAEQVERLLETIEDTADDPALFNAVMYTHASLADKDPDHADNAALIMGKMKEANIPMDIATYATMLLALANAGQVKKAESLLAQMESNVETIGFAPNAVCYNTTLDGLAKSNDPGAPARAEALLKRMDHLYESGVIPEPPDIVSYSSVIDAWCRSSDPSGAESAEKLLFECELKSQSNPSLAPDVVPYNIVLDAYSRRGAGRREGALGRSRVDTSFAERAERLLSHMQEGHNPAALPGTISYNCVLNAWANSNADAKAANRARDILELMKQEYRAGNSSTKPDLITYNVVLRLVAKSPLKERPNEMEDLLQEIADCGFHADAVSYNSVMDSIVKRNKGGDKESAQKVENMLLSMEEQYRNGNTSVQPTEHSYNIAINAYAKSGNPDAAERILQRMLDQSGESDQSAPAPSIVSFSTVIDAYAKTGQADAAEALVHKIDELHDVSPNTISFNSLVNALAKSNLQDAPQRAEAILNRMQQEYESGNDRVRPNAVSFSSVINCWARSGQPGSADRAEAILRRMEELYERGQTYLQPNAVTYSGVLNALSKSREPDAADRALELLDRLEKSHQKGMINTRPNSYCYNAAINAVAKSPIPDKAVQASSLLGRMKHAYENGNHDAQPTVMSYSSVLNACAYTTGSDQLKSAAFRIARLTFKELMDSNIGEPSSITYLNFMMVCIKLLSPGEVQEKMIVATFRECVRGDQVNERIVKLLRANVRPEVFRQCLALVKNGVAITSNSTR